MRGAGARPDFEKASEPATCVVEAVCPWNPATRSGWHPASSTHQSVENSSRQRCVQTERGRQATVTPRWKEIAGAGDVNATHVVEGPQFSAAVTVPGVHLFR